jgi:enediyne biosynthesis protein E4
VRSGGSYLSHNDMRIRFGLGRRTSVPPIAVRWPGGEVERFSGLTANGIHAIRQRQGTPAGPDR